MPLTQQEIDEETRKRAQNLCFIMKCYNKMTHNCSLTEVPNNLMQFCDEHTKLFIEYAGALGTPVEANEVTTS